MKSIGKYQVIEELGSSATGKTYRVRDAFRNREFAAKILETVPGLTAEAKEQFCGHLAACAELTHRQIAKINDLGEVEEGIFVATEWLSGTDLRQFMHENPDLPLDQKLGVVAQVAEGLAFAHSRGIAHGDLKPSNLFIDAARDVSILDFGIAKWLAALLAAGSRPEGLVANYLAPEQVLGKPFDARSDIFALGLILYEFASGKYPFSADPGLIPREIVHGEPEPLGKLDPQVPEELEQLVARALKKDPDQRMKTAEEFASGLYLAAQQIAACRYRQRGCQPAFGRATGRGADRRAASARADATAGDSAKPPATARTGIGRLAGTAILPRQSASGPKTPNPRRSPWTARSYVAGTPLPPNGADLPKPPVVPAPANEPSAPPAPPEFQPPQSFSETGQSPACTSAAQEKQFCEARAHRGSGSRPGRCRCRHACVAAKPASVAEQSHAATAVTEPVEPVAKPSSPPAPAPEARAPKHEEPAPEEVVNPEVSAKQILNGPVRTLWESGRYAQALALVNRGFGQRPKR